MHFQDYCFRRDVVKLSFFKNMIIQRENATSLWVCVKKKDTQAIQKKHLLSETVPLWHFTEHSDHSFPWGAFYSKKTEAVSCVSVEAIPLLLHPPPFWSKVQI